MRQHFLGNVERNLIKILRPHNTFNICIFIKFKGSTVPHDMRIKLNLNSIDALEP